MKGRRNLNCIKNSYKFSNRGLSIKQNQSNNNNRPGNNQKQIRPDNWLSQNRKKLNK